MKYPLSYQSILTACLLVLASCASTFLQAQTKFNALNDFATAQTDVDAKPADSHSDPLEKMLQDRGLVDTQTILSTAAQLQQNTNTNTKLKLQNWTSDVVVSAMAYLGVPYRFGGDSREAGFDCSGFTRYIFSQVLDIHLPRRAAEQAQSTSMQNVDKDQLEPGDLVFFNTLSRAFSHVGIYIGEDKFIHAPRSGTVVRIEDMAKNYWQQRFNGARRIMTSQASTNTKQ